MKVIGCKDYEELSSVVAKIVAEQIKLKSNSVLGLPTGSTPLGMYSELINMYNNNEIDFSNIITFNLDEYYPIKRDNTQSYYYFMHNNLFCGVNIKGENIAIDFYKKIIASLENKNLIPTIEAIIADEETHIIAFTTILDYLNFWN